MIVVEHLTHRFGSQQVLSDVSFELGKGQILAIMGSSGGGKTTLLKCLSGLLKPSEGSIIIDGIDLITNAEKATEKIGLVFQYAALFDSLNVRENILFGVKRHLKLGRKAQDELVETLLEQVSLDPESATKMPGELSGGMRKRVGLARALAMQPEVLLYDEPTSGLDPITAFAIDQLIVATRDKTGAASIVVSHDVTSVMRVADRIAFLSGGEMVFFGTREDFREFTHPGVREMLSKSIASQFSSENH